MIFDFSLALSSLRCYSVDIENPLKFSESKETGNGGSSGESHLEWVPKVQDAFLASNLSGKRTG